uniref:Uncharacterized protein n=1 Tax=Arundo donax TaxID=35708 RepID=A0A0A9B2P2_ARUDO
MTYGMLLHGILLDVLFRKTGIVAK